MPEIRRRVAALGPVQISKPELFLMCGDFEATMAVLDDKLSEEVRAELEKFHLVAFTAGEDWYVGQIDQ